MVSNLERVPTMQTSFSELEYATKKKVTRRDRFLAEIEAITPWSGLVDALEPFYPTTGRRGRPPIGLERMLRRTSGPGIRSSEKMTPNVWINRRRHGT